MLDEFDTLILLKVKPLLDEVLELLDRRGLLATSCFIEKVGSPEQRIVRDLASLKGERSITSRCCWCRTPSASAASCAAAAAGARKSRRRPRHERCGDLDHPARDRHGRPGRRRTARRATVRPGKIRGGSVKPPRPVKLTATAARPASNWVSCLQHTTPSSPFSRSARRCA
jgi:hypothetical protein